MDSGGPRECGGIVGIPKDILREQPAIGDWCILAGYVGSISHGTFRPLQHPNSVDDKDVMGICVPPRSYYIGLDTHGIHKGTKEIKRDEWDIVVYEARKAINLLLKGNPNVLAILWLEENHYIACTLAGQRLLDHRGLFVGRHVYKPFTGYAYAQLRRMESYTFEGYMGEKRKALVDKHGYDTKNASHLIRLLNMGIEFMRDGELYVMRHDAPKYLDIKDGRWTLQQVKDEAERLFRVAEEAYLASTLPKKPDKKLVSELCAEVVELALAERMA
jgi:predicted nucleotidyltransferase